jgi:bifunctional non-homologous end joining protein LigD
MLATLGAVGDIDELDEPWAFEMKWDGIRALATVSGDSVRLHTRNGIDVSVTYPDLAGLAGQAPDGSVLDGEIVALNESGRPDFGLLQRRMKLTRKAEVDAAIRDIPVNYLIFDILNLRGRSVIDLTYDERRKLLLDEVRSAGRIQVPGMFEGDLTSAMEASRTLGLEGVVAKKRESTYSPGRRSGAWVKIKHHKTQEVVVGGWRPGAGRRAHTIGSILLGIPTADGLEYVGRVGTGFNDAGLLNLTATLGRIERKSSPFDAVPRDVSRDARWVSPTLVGEVEFAEWTSSGRLRQPSWRGWRPDKSPGDVVRED